MIGQDRKSKIAELLITSHNFEPEEAHDLVDSYLQDNSEEIDDDINDDEAAKLISDNADSYL